MSEGVELRWPGKFDAEGRRLPVPRPGATLRRRASYRASHRATGAAEPGGANRLIEGDNLFALDALAREEPGTVDLVYIDPPFATGGRFEVVSSVGPRGDGVALRQPAYTDAWPGGVGGLLAMLDPRLRLIHELLAPHGSLYVHVDPSVGHAVKLLLDEIFGPGCFQREIVWRIGWISGFKSRARNWIRNHDLIFFYVKDPARFTFNKHYMPHPPGYRRRDGSLPKGRGVPLDDVWNAGDAELALRGRDSLDSIQIKSFSTEKTGYATQKNESVLRRIIEASSNRGDLVLDAFCGSGTTVAVAEALGRRFIGCDTGRAAIQIATGRLLSRPRCRDFEVLTVVDDERRAWRDRLDVEGRDEATIVAERGAELLGEGVGSLRMRSQGEGVAEDGPQAAWRWSVEVPVESEGDAVLVGEPLVRAKSGSRGIAPQLVLQRAWLDPRLETRPELVFAERARLQIRLHGLASDALEVELLSFGYPSPELLPEALRDVSLGPLDLVERWALSLGDDEDARFDEVLGRFDRDRTLSTRRICNHEGLASKVRLVVMVHDALHREHRLVCELARGAAGWAVTRATAQAES